MNQLTPENYKQGFLVDEELMAGITQDPGNPHSYAAFVLQHTTGEYLGYQLFPNLDSALQALNQIPRTWTYEKFGGCGGGNCGKEGGCKGGACQKGACPI